MCGILFTNRNDISEKRFLNSLDLMIHRGPDATGYAEFKNFKLGHQRLKIVDLMDRSNQPMTSSCKRYTMIFNGEIYNYKELQKKYIKKDLKTSSDTEVLLELYVQFKEKILELIDGMFAFIILDKITNEVFAARDRLGVKPLYYSNTDKGIIISSEINPILSLLESNKFDDIGIRQYLKLRSFFNQHTLYKDIKMFEPGSYYFKGEFKKYWKITAISQTTPSDDELEEILLRSIIEHEQADVSVGSYLSGGLDSSYLSAIANIQHTWTVGFENNNEFEWARIVSEKINSVHHEIIINEDEFIAIAKNMILKTKRPLSVPNEVLLYKMTSHVAKVNKVILSGEGADELFYGYNRIFKWAGSTKSFDIRKFDELYSYGSHDDLEILDYVIEPYYDYKNAIDILSIFFQVSHLEGLLLRLDNSTMLNSVEARVPFVDNRRLIERMLGVQFDGRFDKEQFRRISKSVLPEEIVYRKKVGFPVPLKDIFKNSSSKNDYDNWLNFNLSTLTGDEFIFEEFVKSV